MIKILVFVVFSQIFFLGVFGVGENRFFVYESSSNLCGEFIPGDISAPNWLPEGWQVLNENTGSLSTNSFCKNNGYRYAGLQIGIQNISNERAGAEFLASKGFIVQKNLNPSDYKLNQNISRKEIMKVIANIGDLTINEENCNYIFDDVPNDWGCKYIESALKNNYISENINFRPNDTLTKSEALKLIFKARNIEKRYNTGYWQEDYISTAYYLGFIDSKFSNYNEDTSRGWFFSAAAKSYDTFSNK